jgi:(3R)-3-hydroxyacyl-CoA dehydrogenase / 3a,7a,12a-trihydroxy-5b-cholest-24-enoyl-CoA hydratase / enoyl-CoA hydratase 2
MPINKNIINKKYPSTTHIISEQDSIFYALAYNEDNDAYFDKRKPGGIIVPPMYAVRYMGECIENIIKDPETGINISMMVHHSQEFEWIRHVRAGDTIISAAQIKDILPGQFGEKMICSVSSTCNGKPAVNSIWTFLDRSSPSPEAEKERPKKYIYEPLFEQQMHVRNGQTYIYARASGDLNPIHIDEQKAIEAGLDGIILHGLCTMAFAHKACVDKLCGDSRDPVKIRKLSVQFARPVKPGDDITFKIYRNGSQPDGEYDIKAVNRRNKDIFYNAKCSVV